MATRQLAPNQQDRNRQRLAYTFEGQGAVGAGEPRNPEGVAAPEGGRAQNGLENWVDEAETWARRLRCRKPALSGQTVSRSCRLDRPWDLSGPGPGREEVLHPSRIPQDTSRHGEPL